MRKSFFESGHELLSITVVQRVWTSHCNIVSKHVQKRYTITLVSFYWQNTVLLVFYKRITAWGPVGPHTVCNVTKLTRYDEG